MPLSDADKTFIAATASLDPQRDKPAIYDAWRKTHGPAAADMSNQQVAARIRRMPSDEVKDEKEQLSALGSAARRVAVKDMNQEVFREREVLALMALGLGNPEIADRLVISRSTAKFHVSSIISKLGAGGRTEAVAVAFQLHLVN